MSTNTIDAVRQKNELAGTSQKDVDLAPIVIHEITLVGSRCGPFDEALDLLAGGSVDVLSLIGRRMKLDDGVEALRVARQPDTIKVLLEVA